jgi:hypothetical protein
MNGIIKNAATKLTMEKAIISKCKKWCSVLSWAATLSLALKPQRK